MRIPTLEEPPAGPEQAPRTYPAREQDRKTGKAPVTRKNPFAGGMRVPAVEERPMPEPDPDFPNPGAGIHPNLSYPLFNNGPNYPGIVSTSQDIVAYRREFKFVTSGNDEEPHTFNFYLNRFFIDLEHKTCVGPDGFFNWCISDIERKAPLPVHLHCEILRGIQHYLEGFHMDSDIISKPFPDELWKVMPMIQKHTEAIFCCMYKYKTLAFLKNAG